MLDLTKPSFTYPSRPDGYSFTFDSTGVVIEGDVPSDPAAWPIWLALWHKTVAPWWIGDLFRWGEQYHGESLGQALDLRGMTTVNAEQLAAWVGSSVNRMPSDRFEFPFDNIDPKFARFKLGVFDFFQTGVSLCGRPSIGDFSNPVYFSMWLQRSAPWWIGDLLHNGPAALADQITKPNGPASKSQVGKWRREAGRIEKHERYFSLSWSAHCKCGAMEPAARKQWYRYAIDGGLGSQELGEAITERRAIQNA